MHKNPLYLNSISPLAKEVLLLYRTAVHITMYQAPLIALIAFISLIALIAHPLINKDRYLN